MSTDGQEDVGVGDIEAITAGLGPASPLSALIEVGESIERGEAAADPPASTAARFPELRGVQILTGQAARFPELFQEESEGKDGPHQASTHEPESEDAAR